MPVPPECDWEMGGVPEATPEPCSLPFLVAHDGTLLVAPDLTADPFLVDLNGTPVVEVVEPVAVTGSFATTTELSDDLSLTIQYGFGLVVFFLAIACIHLFWKRNA